MIGRRQAGATSLALLSALFLASRSSWAEEPGATPSPEAPVEPGAAPIEVVVTGQGSGARRLQESAEAVTVVNTKPAQRRSADLAEVLARQQGVAVRRSGGLGSDTRLSLNGLWDTQIRTFVDGVPVEMLYPFGTGDVPVGFVNRVEIYRGVVPIRFGADALGGAVNLVTEDRSRTGGEASYQVGSFGTYRATAAARYRSEAGWYAGAAAFADTTKNDYFIDVMAPDAHARPQPARVRRFHDAYAARGGSVELGVLDKPWAKLLLVRGFGSSFEKQIQHDFAVSRPEGEAERRGRLRGGLLRYEVELAPRALLELLALRSSTNVELTDPEKWIYSWFGRRVREVRMPEPIDRVYQQVDDYARALFTWRPADRHTLRVATTAALSHFTGDDRQRELTVDPLEGEQSMLRIVTGAEHELRLFDERLENIAFAKNYLYHLEADAQLPTGDHGHTESDRLRFGLGDGVRYRFAPFVYAKLSYEYTTRLPSTYEVFGDGLFVRGNPELAPERGHNLNLGPTFELARSTGIDLTLDVSGFWRRTTDQIVAIGADFVRYQNVYAATTRGVEAALGWSSPRRLVTVGGTGTYLDSRNDSTTGPFADQAGDRIPNRPWLFASWSAAFKLPLTSEPGTSIEFSYGGRYVHAFYRSWESIGQEDLKLVIPEQLTHDFGISHRLIRERLEISTTLEVLNATDARVFDNYGIERPGRAFYLKLLARL